VPKITGELSCEKLGCSIQVLRVENLISEPTDEGWLSSLESESSPLTGAFLSGQSFRADPIHHTQNVERLNFSETDSRPRVLDTLGMLPVAACNLTKGLWVDSNVLLYCPTSPALGRAAHLPKRTATPLF
jgi:hypothetical protein